MQRTELERAGPEGMKRLGSAAEVKRYRVARAIETGRAKKRRATAQSHTCATTGALTGARWSGRTFAVSDRKDFSNFIREELLAFVVRAVQGRFNVSSPF